MVFLVEIKFFSSNNILNVFYTHSTFPPGLLRFFTLYIHIISAFIHVCYHFHKNLCTSLYFPDFFIFAKTRENHINFWSLKGTYLFSITLYNLPSTFCEGASNTSGHSEELVHEYCMMQSASKPQYWQQKRLDNFIDELIKIF